MCQTLILLWAIATAVTVLILFVRDPSAHGVHPARTESLPERIQQRLVVYRQRLCDKGLCLACAKPA